MAKKSYKSPILRDIDPGEIPTIPIYDSQGTSGDISQWAFADGFDQDIIDLIELWCSDFDLDAMDSSGDFIITMDEFNAWYEDNPWFPL